MPSHKGLSLEFKFFSVNALATHLSIYLPNFLSTCLLTHLFIHLPFHPANCPSLYPTIINNKSSYLESTTIRSRVGNSTQQEDHPYSQISTVGYLLDIVCILWFKLGVPLAKEDNIDLRSVLDNKVSRCILVLFNHYRDTPISNTVVYLASFLSSSSTAVIGSYCLSQLKKSANFEIHVESLCNWRRGDEVLELLKEWIRDGLSKTDHVEQSGVRFREPNTEEPKVRKAILVINHLLRTNAPRKRLLAKNEVQLVDFLKEISGIKLTKNFSLLWVYINW
ncbi:condensin-2 complex subunit G2 [Eurytemora carolleeae]|uniref:condensin-2 complex subunit G2 n=1 Tax=Eurytemora carolleeae TaxID=1294199 RepID=UPI000C77B9DF|nr:condensin-2 complex subunit G2 [Eurytemora carolleeae]|eukprot:XP_023329487.1 condensin-2 complex subunit G2-like [Eurytemora affinis]